MSNGALGATRNNEISWSRAVALVAGETAEAAMLETAMRLLDRIPHEDWATLLVAHMIADARHQQRADALRVERRAVEANRRVSAKEWSEWSERRRQALDLPPSTSPMTIATADVAAPFRDLRMEWTRELLGTVFALKDGTTVRCRRGVAPQLWSSRRWRRHSHRR